ncbi:hypothetical protein ACWEKJ_10545 [Amycolatopsis thermoflava]
MRVILSNPRYTGRQVWNKQRKDEFLIDVDDVDDVTLGHRTRMRWNGRDKWIFSDDILHNPLIRSGYRSACPGHAGCPRYRSHHAGTAPHTAPIRVAWSGAVRVVRAAYAGTAESGGVCSTGAGFPVSTVRRTRLSIPAQRLPCRT